MLTCIGPKNSGSCRKQPLLQAGEMRADRAERDSEHGEWESSVTGHAEGRSTRITQRHSASGEQKTTLEWKPSKREEERKTTAPEHGRKLSRRGSMRLWRDTEKHHHNHSIQFSRSVVSNSLWPHGLQHARPPFLHFLEYAQVHVH